MIELISKEENFYINVFNRKDLIFDKKNLILNKKSLAGINKAIKMLGKNEEIKMWNIRHIFYEIEHTTFSHLRLEIKFIENKFKLIKFINSKKKLANELVNKETIIRYISIKQNNNCFSFKNNLKYIYTKFI